MGLKEPARESRAAASAARDPPLRQRPSAGSLKWRPLLLRTHIHQHTYTHTNTRGLPEPQHGLSRETARRSRLQGRGDEISRDLGTADTTPIPHPPTTPATVAQSRAMIAPQTSPFPLPLPLGKASRTPTPGMRRNLAMLRRRQGGGSWGSGRQSRGECLACFAFTPPVSPPRGCGRPPPPRPRLPPRWPSRSP